MEATGTRKVERVRCWLHNVVILECRENTGPDSPFGFRHAVTMFTPAQVELTLVPDENEKPDYFESNKMRLR